jgi:alkylation response protein AidB-like acyl-CoA dehydrogenase
VVRSVLEAAAPGRPPAPAETAQTRVARLEALLGDPTDPGNPLGYGALLEADRAAVPFAEGEAVLDDFGLNAEFVPRELGGRLDGIDTLVRVMRPVFRRDVGLAMGYGMTTYMAASDVWTTGSERQREWLAALLLGGGRAAIAQHETAHSNDYVRSQVTARHAQGGFLLSGGKPMINNLDRAEALVLFCRTDDARAERIKQYQEELMHPYYAAERGLVDDVIDPADTRAVLIRSLAMLRTKHAPLPARKHGNPPM